MPLRISFPFDTCVQISYFQHSFILLFSLPYVQAALFHPGNAMSGPKPLLRCFASPTSRLRFASAGKKGRGDARSLDLSDATLKAHTQQFLRFNREFHREFTKYFLAEAIHNHINGILQREAALLAIEDLIFPNF